MDLFRRESATLRTHRILVVMDQYSRRIIGLGVHIGAVDSMALCCKFNHAIGGHPAMPKYLSSNCDHLYRFGQWQATPRILEVTEIKTVPYWLKILPWQRGAVKVIEVWSQECRC